MINKATFLTITLAVLTICIVVGIAFKILHYPLSEAILSIGLIAALLFTIVALTEIWSSRSIGVAEKVMWATGFIVLNGLAAMLYLLAARKRILQAPADEFERRY